MSGQGGVGGLQSALYWESLEHAGVVELDVFVFSGIFSEI